MAYLQGYWKVGELTKFFLHLFGEINGDKSVKCVPERVYIPYPQAVDI